MNRKIIVLCLLQAITLSLCSMDAPDPDKEKKSEQSEENNSACYFDTMPDELALHIFGYAANQETVKERFLQLSQLSLVHSSWASLAKDQLFLKSIIQDQGFIALGEKLANKVSEGKEIAWTCPNYLPCQAKESIKSGLLKKSAVLNFLKRIHEDRKAWITSVAISSDNSFIVTGADDKMAKIRDVLSGNCITTLEGHIDGITSVAISSDNRFIVTGSRDKTSILYPVLHNQELVSILQRLKEIKHE